MVINVTNTLVRDVYGAIISTELSSREMTFVNAYGEPKIDVGGIIPLVDPVTHVAILDSHSVPETITLVSTLVYIRSGFPVQQAFNGNIDNQAFIKVSSWAWAVRNLLTAAKNTLMANAIPSSPNTNIYEV